MYAARSSADADRAAVAIAHRSGNDRRTLTRAIQLGVDWVEADIWCQYGHLVARHERALWRLPLRYDEWKLAIALRPALRLGEICDALAGGPQLLIDFKGSGARLPVAVVDCLRAKQAVDRAAICGQDWSALDAAVAREPRLRAFYSIGSEWQLEALRRRPPASPRVSAVSCAEFLLTPDLLAEFRQRGIAVFAWTVNDRARAAELLSAGVYGITSDSAAVLAAVRDFQPPPRPS